MMVSANFGGNVHQTVDALNEKGIAWHVHSFIPISEKDTVVIFDFKYYPDYVRFCERMGEKPVSTEKFFQ